MPKKRDDYFKHLQGHSATRSSTSLGQRQNASNQGAVTTVNAKLLELRSIPSPESTQKKREMAEAVNQPTVPPHLMSILGVSESTPPLRSRARTSFRDRTRTPGPAPPRSWLLPVTVLRLQTPQSRGGAASIGFSGSSKKQPPRLHHFAKLCGIEVPEHRRFLTHWVLKKLATSWYLLDEVDFASLEAIPSRLRISLLSYLGYYANFSITPNTLKALTQGAEKLTFLDLSALAGYGTFTTSSIANLMASSNREAAERLEDDVADSWDTVDEVSPPSIPVYLSTFHDLTHLSLSYPSNSVSWKDLFAICRQVPQLTHLSLAYWPRPTLAPKSYNNAVVRRNVPASGSHYYSNSARDMVEPADLLRQFSTHLLCLRWLDIEGCAEWMPALAAVLNEDGDTSGDDQWTAHSTRSVSIFSNKWANLSVVRCLQGWMPTHSGVRSMLYLPEDGLKAAVMIHLREEDKLGPTQYRSEVETQQAGIWLEDEHRMLVAAKRINSSRRADSRKPITFDFGWRAYAP